MAMYGSDGSKVSLEVMVKLNLRSLIQFEVHSSNEHCRWDHIFLHQVVNTFTIPSYFLSQPEDSVFYLLWRISHIRVHCCVHDPLWCPLCPP